MRGELAPAALAGGCSDPGAAVGLLRRSSGRARLLIVCSAPAWDRHRRVGPSATPVINDGVGRHDRLIQYLDNHHTSIRVFP